MSKIWIILMFIPGILRAQNIPDYDLHKVRIVEADKTEVVEINPVPTPPKIQKDRFYYWYAADLIHSTQGGFSGHLLNGQYNAYYTNKNLREQGTFSEGLKNGTWRSWNDDGTLRQVITWKNGVQQPDEKVPFWKKLNIFKRKKVETAAPTVQKPT